MGAHEPNHLPLFGHQGYCINTVLGQESQRQIAIWWGVLVPDLMRIYVGLCVHGTNKGRGSLVLSCDAGLHGVWYAHEERYSMQGVYIWARGHDLAVVIVWRFELNARGHYSSISWIHGCVLVAVSHRRQRVVIDCAPPCHVLSHNDKKKRMVIDYLHQCSCIYCSRMINWLIDTNNGYWCWVLRCKVFDSVHSIGSRLFGYNKLGRFRAR